MMMQIVTKPKPQPQPEEQQPQQQKKGRAMASLTAKDLATVFVSTPSNLRHA